MKKNTLLYLFALLIIPSIANAGIKEYLKKFEIGIGWNNYYNVNPMKKWYEKLNDDILSEKIFINPPKPEDWKRIESQRGFSTAKIETNYELLKYKNFNTLLGLGIEWGDGGGADYCESYNRGLQDDPCVIDWFDAYFLTKTYVGFKIKKQYFKRYRITADINIDKYFVSGDAQPKIYLTDPNTYRIYLQQQIAHYNGNGLGFSFGSSLSYQVGYFLVGINYGYIKANIPTSGEKMKFFGMNRELTYEYTPKFEFDGNYIGVEAKYKFGEPVEEPLTSLICKIKTSKMSVEENLTFLVFNHTAYNLKKKEYIISLLGFEYGWTDQIQIGGRGGIELSFSRDSFLEIGQNWTYIKVNEETLRWVISLMLYRKMDSLLVIRERRSDDSYRSSSFDMYDSYGYQVAVARKLGSITVFHTGIGNLGFFAGLEKKLSKSSRRLLLEISNNSVLNVWSTGIALYFHPKKTYKYKLGLGSFLFEKKIHISPIIHFYWKF